MIEKINNLLSEIAFLVIMIFIIGFFVSIGPLVYLDYKNKHTTECKEIK